MSAKAHDAEWGCQILLCAASAWRALLRTADEETDPRNATRRKPGSLAAKSSRIARPVLGPPRVEIKMTVSSGGIKRDEYNRLYGDGEANDKNRTP